MGGNFTLELKRLLTEAGCQFERTGKVTTTFGSRRIPAYDSLLTAKSSRVIPPTAYLSRHISEQRDSIAESEVLQTKTRAFPHAAGFRISGHKTLLSTQVSEEPKIWSPRPAC
jgi:hypothetical protein